MGTRDIHCSSHMIDLVGHARHLDGVALVDAASFSNPQSRGNAAPREIESRRSWRNRSSTTGMGPAMTHNNNHPFEGNYIARSFQQQAIIDGRTLIWNHSSARPYVHGSDAGGPRETGHGSSVTFLRSTPHNLQAYNYYYPSSVIQGLTDHNTNMHQVAGSHQLPISYVAQNTMNPSHAGLEMQPRHLLPMLTHGPRIYHFQQEGHVAEASQRHGNLARLRFLTPEEVAVLELPGDMHLDIEDASYEELLGLGERIGNVNTGFSEEIITSKLKTRTYLLAATKIHLEETAALGQEPDLCTICQEEYKYKEKIGTLSCGHEYHADCVKNWLLLKNECPICRSRGLTLD